MLLSHRGDGTNSPPGQERREKGDELEERALESGDQSFVSVRDEPRRAALPHAVYVRFTAANGSALTRLAAFGS
jgi:hypothetical protein